jgi:hypothetical protein
MKEDYECACVFVYDVNGYIKISIELHVMLPPPAAAQS